MLHYAVQDLAFYDTIGTPINSTPRGGQGYDYPAKFNLRHKTTASGRDITIPSARVP